MSLKKFTLSLASLASLSLLVACSPKEQVAPSTQASTSTEVEPDGDQEIKKVTFEPENQRVFIGDDIKVYVADGNQIIIDDMDREISDRIVLKK